MTGASAGVLVSLHDRAFHGGLMFRGPVAAKAMPLVIVLPSPPPSPPPSLSLARRSPAGVSHPVPQGLALLSPQERLPASKELKPKCSDSRSVGMRMRYGAMFDMSFHSEQKVKKLGWGPHHLLERGPRRCPLGVAPSPVIEQSQTQHLTEVSVAGGKEF